VGGIDVEEVSAEEVEKAQERVVALEDTADYPLIEGNYDKEEFRDELKTRIQDLTGVELESKPVSAVVVN